MAGPGNIMIRVGADTDGARRGLSQVSGALEDTRTRSQKMGDGIRRATLPAVAVLTGLAVAGKKAADAAMEDEAAANALAGALKRTTGATDAQVAATEAYIGKLETSVGVADDELRPALAKLATATGDVGKAQDALALALDISAATGKSLDAVSVGLAKAYGGQTAGLARLVPGLDAATLKSKDMAKITDELARLTGGAAADAAETSAGRYRIMQVQLANLQETIGYALIPVVNRLVSIVSQATRVASEHTTAAKIAIGVVAGLAAGVLVARAAMAVYSAAVVAVRVATAAATVAQQALNLAMRANPIGLVVTAVAALTAALVIAYQRSETFRNAVNGAWAVLRNSPLGGVVSAFESLANAVARVVGWISQIRWPSPPSWLGKIGGIFGALRGAPAGAAPAARRVGGRPFGGPAAGSRPRSSSSALARVADGSGGVTIHVFGATDPEGTARAIRRTLRGHARRQGALYRLGEAP